MEQQVPRQQAEPVQVTEPALFIRLVKNYKPDMSARALYDATRGVWRIGPRRELARYAFAVNRGIVVEVYEIDTWHTAGTTYEASQGIDKESWRGRWEFTGKPAADEIRTKYTGKSVAGYFRMRAANPVTYVNCVG